MNELVTKFVFLDTDGKKVDALRDKILSTNNDFENLGKNLTFGKTINDNSELAGKSVETLQKKVEDFKTTTEGQSFKPTISRYWENEANQVVSSAKKAENAIDGLNNKGYTPSQPVGFTLPGTQPSAKPAFADSYKSGLDDIDSRLEKTRTSFQKLADTRAGKGQFDTIYQGAFAAEKKTNDLINRVRTLKKESADPANSKYFEQYKNGIREAENELSRLESKQRSLSRSAGASGGGRGRRGLGETGRAVLEVADDFVPAGLNKPFNAVVKEVAKIESLSLGVLGAWAGIGVAAYAIVAASISIREEAKKRLKTEQDISVEYGKQNTAINDLIKNTQVEREKASLNRYLSGGASLDELRARKKTLEELQRIETKYRAPTEELGSALKENDALIAAKEKENIKSADDRFAQSFESRKKAEEAEFQRREKAAQDLAKKQIEYFKKVRDAGLDFTEFIGEAKSSDNPIVKVLTDIETLTVRVQKRFGVLGDEFVKAGEKAERANLTKKLGLLQFQSQSDGLRFNQDARRVAGLSETQFASFQRAIETVSKSVEFAAGSGSLGRQIQEARFYASQYNPNNPKSFNEFNRRGANDDFSETSVQIRSAVEDIKSLNQINLQGTGIYGQGAIADKILSIIPSREELLKRLENPVTRGEAQFLLNQQYGALTSKRDFEQTKFNDFLQSQKNLELNKQFAREQIDLLDSKGLDKFEAAKQLLNITNPLGNDVDVNLQRRIYQANLDAGAAKINENREALELARANAKSTEAINEKLNKIISEKGLKIDKDDLPAPVINVNAKDFSVTGDVLGAAPRPEDMLGNVFGSGFNQ